MSETIFDYNGRSVKCTTSEFFYKKAPLYKAFISLDPESNKIDFEYSCWFDKEKNHSDVLDKQVIEESKFALKCFMDELKLNE